MIKNKKSFIIAVIIIFLILLCKYKSFTERNEKNPYPIAWDVFGYYLYLPATFIYHDIGLEDRAWLDSIRKKYNPSTTAYQITAGKDNKQVIVYNIGYSLIDAPGFLIAHAIAEVAGYEADGFSKPYQYSLELTAFIFTLLGIYMFRNISLRFFSDTLTAMLLVIILIGTNYFYQVTYDGVMPHNILFTLNCFIVWFSIQWHETKKIKYIVFLSIFLGLASICRPTELICIIIPILWGVQDKKSLFDRFYFLKTYSSQVALFTVVLISILFIQFSYLKYATGSFMAVNFHSESFSFFDPYTFKFLFSYRKGWLLYTPIMIFGIIGFYHLYKQNRSIWFSLVLFFVINLYVVSSWECWWYGASYSQRPMVETYAMMLFPMGYFFKWLIQLSKKWIRFSVGFLVTFLIILNLFQTWQYLNYIIDIDRMTQQYYWKVFAKTSVTEEERQYLSVDRNQAVFADYENYSEKYYKKEGLFLNFEAENPSSKNIIDTTAMEGKKSFLLNSETQFSEAFEELYANITPKKHIWVRSSVWVYLVAPFTESNSCIVIGFQSKGKFIKYLTSDYNNFNVPLHKWTEIHLDFLSPDIRHGDDKIISYFWNMGTQPVLIDNFKVEIFEPKVEWW